MFITVKCHDRLHPEQPTNCGPLDMKYWRTVDAMITSMRNDWDWIDRTQPITFHQAAIS